ncbi:MAG: hypothetical protein AAGJ85_06395 [Pseudomonadota bacterium]
MHAQKQTSTSRFMHRLLLALPFLFLASPASIAETAPEKPMSTWALIDAVKEGGYVLYVRHERTEIPSRADDYTRPPNECRAQRNLSVSGVAAAYETGAVIRDIGIPIGRVVSSPMCRAAETSRYMFGVDYELDTRLMHHDPSENSARNMAVAVEEAKAVLSEVGPNLEGTNIVLVGHGGTIRRATGLSVTEGEIAVLQVSDTGEIKALGQLTGSALGLYSRWQSSQGE